MRHTTRVQGFSTGARSSGGAQSCASGPSQHGIAGIGQQP